MKNNSEQSISMYTNTRKYIEEAFIPIGIIIMLLWVAIFVIYPYIQMFVTALYENGVFTLKHFEYQMSEYVFRIFTNTLRLGLTTASVSTLLAYFLAFGMTQIKIKNKKLLNFIYILPTITPPFLFSLSIIVLFGRRGLITYNLLNLTTNIYGYPGLVLAQTMSFFPFAYLLLRGLLTNLNPSLDEAALVLGANQYKKFKTVTLPLTFHGIIGAFVLVLMFSFTDLGNPVIIGGDYTVWASEIYSSVIGQYNLSLGSAMALSLIIPVSCLFFIQKYFENKGSFATITGNPSKSKMQIENPGTSRIFSIVFISFAAFIILLYIMVITGSLTRLVGVDYTPTLEHFRTIFGVRSRGIKTIIDTLILGGAATILGTLISVVLGYIFVRKENIPGKNIFDVLLSIPLALPGVSTGIAYAIAFNKSPFIWSGTAYIIIAILAVRVIPYGLRIIIKAIKQIDFSMLDASYILGGNDFKTFVNIVIPLIKDSITAAIIYNFTRCITTLSAVIFVISIDWDLVSAAILNKVEEGKTGQAAAYGVVLFLIVVTINLFLMRHEQKREDEA